MKALLISEANREVATGHLMESVELAKGLENEGVNVCLVVNEKSDKVILKNISYPLTQYYDYKQLKDIIQRFEPSVVVTDLRKVENDFIVFVKKCVNCPVIAIDELGHRFMSSDIIINPMVDPWYWEYEGCDEMYFGAEYLILSRELQKYRQAERRISDCIKKICVSMGGVDIKGTVIKLIPWIQSVISEAEIEITLGNGFMYEEELLKIVDNSNISIIKNKFPIYDNFVSSDIVFCAGGNTLHELAALGVPAITIPTMPHEVRNGKAFEANGFGMCLPITDEVEKTDVEKALLILKDANIRKKMSNTARIKYDGLGLKRNKEIIIGALT